MKFRYIVEIDTDTQEHADEVMAERIGYDEDLGFEYTIDMVEDKPTWMEMDHGR